MAIAQNIVSSLLTALVAVAVHRWVLLNEVQPGLSWSPPYTRLFFFWVLALHLLYLLRGLPVPLLINETIRAGFVGQHPRPAVDLTNKVPALIMIETSTYLVMLAVSAYLALLFPDVAIGEFSPSWIARIKASVARLNGNFWLLVWAAILAFLPVIAINMIMFFTAAPALSSWGRRWPTA